MKWLAILSALIMISSCFFPWVVIDSKELVFSGMYALNYGKPGYLHLVLAAIYLICVLSNSSVGQKVAVVAAALNIAWAVRNALLISACQMGECPVKKPALFVLVFSSVLMLLFVLFMRPAVRFSK